jgi:hypothetical protein
MCRTAENGSCMSRSLHAVMGTIEWFTLSNIYSTAECNNRMNHSIVFIRIFIRTAAIKWSGFLLKCKCGNNNRMKTFHYPLFTEFNSMNWRGNFSETTTILYIPKSFFPSAVVFKFDCLQFLSMSLLHDGCEIIKHEYKNMSFVWQHFDKSMYTSTELTKFTIRHDYSLLI